MKYRRESIFLCFLLSFSLQLMAKPTKYQYPQGRETAIEGALSSTEINNFNAQSILKRAKYQIVTGNLNYAKSLLNESSLSVNLTKTVQYRYLAIINFIEGDYQKVLDTLSKPEMIEFKAQSKICILRILSLIILNRSEQAKAGWRSCRESTRPYSDSNLAWMQIIVDLKTNKDKGFIDKIFNEVAIDTIREDQLRLYLKLALFLNKQDRIIPRFKYFGNSPLENKLQRELIGLNYYRNGNLVKAYQLLKDLDSANAEVFKGNIHLSQKNYPLAYAQYKLALKRKSNSRNALNRLLPLSWKLGQWKEGIKYLQSVEVTEEDEIENNTLMAVFLTLIDKHNAANTFLRKITKLTNKAESVEVSQLKVLNHIVLNNTFEIENAAANSCASNDGLNCWLLLLMNSWEGITDKFKSDLPVHKGLVDLAEKYSATPINNPLVETKLIDQKRVEELDNNLIILK